MTAWKETLSDKMAVAKWNNPEEIVAAVVCVPTINHKDFLS